MKLWLGLIVEVAAAVTNGWAVYTGWVYQKLDDSCPKKDEHCRALSEFMKLRKLWNCMSFSQPSSSAQSHSLSYSRKSEVCSGSCWTGVTMLAQPRCPRGCRALPSIDLSSSLACGLFLLSLLSCLGALMLSDSGTGFWFCAQTPVSLLQGHDDWPVRTVQDTLPIPQ